MTEPENMSSRSKAMAERPSVPPAKSGSRFSEEEIEQGLMALALESGSGRRAEKRLAKLGLRVDHSTLHRWRNRHAEKYESLQRDVLPKLRMEAAERHSGLADEEMQVGLELLDRLREKKDKLDARDLSTAIRNLDVGQGIHRTKAAELRGDLPSAPTVQFNMVNMIRSMGETGAKFSDAEGKPLSTEEAIRRAKGEAIEGTATEEQTGGETT